MKIASFLYLVLCVFCTQLVTAKLNVLVIGSSEDSSKYTNGASAVSAFSPEQVVTEFTSILEGAGLGEINVGFEDFNGKVDHYKHTNLLSWFHFPYPERADKAKRWVNLQGKLDTKWDYVVLIGDAHTLEYLPGFYALGVSEIGKEVAKGEAETVLLMPWPAEGSKSTVDHYREVIYRIGRSGGYAVAPAGIVWEKSEAESGIKHPTEKGAYIAAATLYSRLFDKSASSSSYRYDNELADLAYSTVQENKGASQYKGKFITPHPHNAQFNSNRKVRYSFTGTSTELSHMERLRYVMAQCGVEYSDDLSHRYDSNDPIADKGGWSKDVQVPIDFNIGKFGFYPYDEFNVNPEFWKRGYTFQYQGFLKTPDQAIAHIAVHDMNAGVKAYRNAPYLGATIPRTSWTLLDRLHPGIKMNGSGNHLSNTAILPNASFIYTCESGRCPLTPEVEKPTKEWNAMKVGYEAGWIMSNLQTRAPGFRVLPSAADKHEINNYSPTGPEEMTVQFIFKPQEVVTVNLTSTNPDLIKISPSSLTFTPENYDKPQSYKVSIVDGAPQAEVEVTVKVMTSSEDEVYNNLSDSWLYTVKSRGLKSLPIAVKDSYRVAVNKRMEIAKDAGVLINDISNLRKSITKAVIGENVTNGALTLNANGSFSYSPNKDFQGRDYFTYHVRNTNGKSEEARVTLTVSDIDSSLILWYEFEEINGSLVKDSTAYGRDGKVVKSISQVSGAAEGEFGVDLTGGLIDIPIDQEFYDLLDREISISFWGYLDPVEKGKPTSTLLSGTKMYDDKQYKSLGIKFQSNMTTGVSNIIWSNGIYTQNKRVSSYSIRNTQKHSKGRIPLTPDVINGKWVHWTFVINKNSGFFRVFKDRVLAFQGSLAGLNAFGLIDEIDKLELGNSFKGKIDDFRIYNRELKVPEITQIMIESRPLAATSLKKVEK